MENLVVPVTTPDCTVVGNYVEVVDVILNKKVILGEG